jgi:hypothetical protein
MLENIIITFYAEMCRLETQGVPIDWKKACQQMSNTATAELAKKEAAEAA